MLRLDLAKDACHVGGKSIASVTRLRSRSLVKASMFNIIRNTYTPSQGVNQPWCLVRVDLSPFLAHARGRHGARPRSQSPAKITLTSRPPERSIDRLSRLRNAKRDEPANPRDNLQRRRLRSRLRSSVVVARAGRCAVRTAGDAEVIISHSIAKRRESKSAWVRLDFWIQIERRDSRRRVKAGL